MKRNYMRSAVLFAMSLAAVLAARGIPAKPGLAEYPMPDGSSVTVSIVGDEFARYYLSADGYLLLPDSKGELRYALAGKNGITLSSRPAKNIAARSAEDVAFLRSLDREAIVASAEKEASARRLQARRRIPSGIVTDYPTTGSPKALILLVEFQDVKFSTPDANVAFNDLVNKPGYDHNGATGSCADFYRDNSMGRFTPEFCVYGPVTLPQNEAYYGTGNAMMYDMQGWMMARDAAIALKEQHPEVNFADFDNDGDGFVDNIFIFYAGYGENEGAPSWTIWPHSAQLWTMYGADVSFDGVKVDKYACTNELRGTEGTVRTGIGTFVHEFGHILGLMDIYPTGLSGASRNVSPGTWDTMDNASYNNDGNTPAHFTAFERYTLGWLNPRRVTAAEDIVLRPLHSSNDAVLISTDKDEEFFLLENRQQQEWDRYTGGHGMLVWHVDYSPEVWTDNKINNNFSHQRVDLIEADGIYGDATRAGDPFPGAGNVRSLTADTNPAMTTWIGVDPDMPLTDISEIDGNITFRVKGGGESLQIPVPLDASDVTPVSFRANWELASAISHYEVDVCRGAAEVPFRTIAVDGATSVVVDGLDPATQYSYVVRSKDGNRTSASSERIFATTADATIDLVAPHASAPLAVGETDFTAAWEPLNIASGYLLSVYRKDIIDPVTDTVDFADRLNLPEGWSTNCASTGSLSGYFGQAAPSLRMTADGDRIVSPEYTGGINSFYFWYRGNSTGDDASLSLEAFRADAWQPLADIAPLVRTEGTRVNISNIPSDATRVRIVFNRGNAGSVYIDDIALAHDGSFVPRYLDSYRDLDCGSALSARVDGLDYETQYFYTVTAYDGDGLRSLPSAEVEVVTLKKDSGIANATLSGVNVRLADKALLIIADASHPVTLATLSGIVIASTRTVAGETISLPVAPGHYILRVGTTARHIIIP